MTPGTAVFPMPPAVCARQSLRWFASLRARVVCARAARFEIFARVRAWRSRLNPLPRFSRRRKECPTPVPLSERRRRVGRGGHSPLPREAAIGQLAGHAVVEAVVRCLTHSDQIPAAPLPAGEIFHRVDVVGNGGQLVPAEPCGLSASVLVTPEHRVAQVQPAFAFVIHGQTKSAMTSRRRSWRSCHPAITSGAKQKRQTILRFHGQIIWRWH